MSETRRTFLFKFAAGAAGAVGLYANPVRRIPNETAIGTIPSLAKERLWPKQYRIGAVSFRAPLLGDDPVHRCFKPTAMWRPLNRYEFTVPLWHEQLVGFGDLVRLEVQVGKERVSEEVRIVSCDEVRPCRIPRDTSIELSSADSSFAGQEWSAACGPIRFGISLPAGDIKDKRGRPSIDVPRNRSSNSFKPS